MDLREIREFDVQALYDALDEKRQALGPSWRGVADELWKQSFELNDTRRDHPISPSTLTSMPKRAATSCQRSLFMLRWLGRAPESFLVGAGPDEGKPLPEAGPNRRLRFQLVPLYEALERERVAQRLTWAELATTLRCHPGQPTGIKRARFATGIGLAMRITQWLERPASDFVAPRGW